MLEVKLTISQEVRVLIEKGLLCAAQRHFTSLESTCAAFGCYEVKSIAAVPTLCKSCGCKFCYSEKL